MGSGGDTARRQVAGELSALGITVLLGAGHELPAGTDLVVTSPGWRPDAPLLAAAAAAGIPVIGDVELAWRLRPALADGTRQQWLGVTGTNGKTTTVEMLAAMLAAAAQPDRSPVLAVELSSFQLHWSATVAPMAAVVLNVAGHHLDWHGDIESYARDKGRISAPGT